MDYGALKKIYQEKYDKEARVFRSPGRINLIGEHTDYNNGFVLPAAVDKEICMLAAPNGLNETRIFSIDENSEVIFNLENYKSIRINWALYIIGVIDELLKSGYKLNNLDIVFTGNIPMGAGMSSSAALECVTTFTYNALFDLKLSKWDIVRISQAAENNYVGVMCGIMDQFASVFGQENAALKLDCRSLEFKAYPVNVSSHVFVLVDTMVKHSLASSEYNTRRIECEEAVSAMKKVNSEINSLRDADHESLNDVKDDISREAYKRAAYIINEIKRVEKATKELSDNNVDCFGQLLYETHYGLQHNFEVSCTELDFLVEQTKTMPYVIGSRMMGGGFGGCTINLVKSEHVEEFKEEISRKYLEKFEIQPSIYSVKTANGTSEIN